MPAPVVNAMKSYLDEETIYGGYETAEKRSTELGQIYPTIAGFINADVDEIALQENATMAWNMAFFAIDFKDGDRILTSVSEYASNYIAYLKLQKKVNVSIEVIPNDEHGQTSVDALSEIIDDKVKLVSITHIPTNSGLVNPVEEIGKVVREYPCLYLVDACQSVGQYPVDVQKINCDMLSATGRKYLRGPRGTGFLYVNKETLPELSPPFLDLHSAKWLTKNQYEMRNDARRFENWETNYTGVLGLKKAISYASDIGIQEIWNRVSGLGAFLRRKLSRLSLVSVQDLGAVKGGIVTFAVEGINPQTVKEKLTDHHINVSTSGKHSTLLDMKARNLEEIIRASVHYYNTEDEINEFINALESITG